MLVKISKTKAYKIEGINYKGKDLISIRQMYATQKDPKLKPGRAGLTFAPEEAEAIRKAIRKIEKAGKFKEVGE